MQEEDKESWTIEVDAKAKNFNFRLKATRAAPSWKLHRLSILLKIRRSFIRVNANALASIPSQQRGTLIPKFFRISKKIRSRWTKNEPFSPKKSRSCPNPEAKFALNRLRQYAKEEPIGFGSLLMMILGILFKKGVMFISGLVFFLYIALLLKKFNSGKTSKLSLLAVAAALACSAVIDSSNYMKYAETYASKFVWKLWKIVASLIWDTL